MRRPELIDTPLPYLSLQDLGVTIRGLVPDISDAQVAVMESDLFAIQSRYAPENSSHYQIDAAELYRDLESRAARELKRLDRSVGVVYMDKDIGNDQDINTRVFRLNLSRSSSGEIVSRRGVKITAEQQVRAMTEWVNQTSLDEIVLVDDVLAFGDTVTAIAKIVKKASGHDTHTLKMLAGIATSGGIWRGIETAEGAGIEVNALTKVLASEPIEGLTKGMAIPTSRDLTLLGGKIGTYESLSVPYFLPFSTPLPSILGRETGWKQASLDLLDFNEALFGTLESIAGHPITIGLLVLNGYGIPYSSISHPAINFAVPQPEMTIRQYISDMRDVVLRSDFTK